MMLAVLLACTSEPEREREPTFSALAPDLVAQTWEVRLADAATLVGALKAAGFKRVYLQKSPTTTQKWVQR